MLEHICTHLTRKKEKSNEQLLLNKISWVYPSICDECILNRIKYLQLINK